MVRARAESSRWAKIAATCLVLLVALGVCTLRLVGIRAERDDKNEEAVRALSSALEQAGDERNSGLMEAKKAAVQATRVSAALLDPYPAFLLSTIETLESFSPEELTGPQAGSAYERALRLLARDALEEAQTTLEAEISSRAPDDPGLERVRLLLRLTIVLREVRTR